eukprot:3933047-Rhodomonas_salina.1
MEYTDEPIGLLVEMLQSAKFEVSVTWALEHGRFINMDVLKAIWKVQMRPTEVSHVDVRMIFFNTLTNIVKERFFNDPAIAEAHRDPDSSATASLESTLPATDDQTKKLETAMSLLFRGYGGDKFRQRITNFAIEAGVLPALNPTGPVPSRRATPVDVLDSDDEEQTRPAKKTRLDDSTTTSSGGVGGTTPAPRLDPER